MTAMPTLPTPPNPRPHLERGTVVNMEDLPSRPAPILVVGPLAWARKNLFSSWVDTLLTLVSVIVIGAIISSFVTWTVGDANWFVVTFNLRLLMLGRFAPEAEWRVVVLAALTTFTIGLSLAVWMRVPRSVIVGIVAIIIVLIGASPLIRSTTSKSPTYVAAGTNELAFGASKETPQGQLGFIGKAGETVSIRFADQYAKTDEMLSTVYGFSDRAAALLANAAASRLDTTARIDSFDAQLASDLLTDGQRARINTQLAKLKIPPPIVETFGVNRGAVNIRILRGTTLKPVVTGMLTTGSPVVQVILPEDGWYVLEKLPADKADKGAYLLEVMGVDPILDRELSRSSDVDASGNTTAAARVLEYVRVTDNFETQEMRPTPDGKNVPMVIVIDNAYRGEHSISDFFRLFVGPFFDAIGGAVTILIVAGILGYLSPGIIDRVAPNPESPRHNSQRAATWLLIALPVLMFGLVYGVGNILPLTDTRRWGGLLLTIMLTVVSIIASFPIGILLALGRRSTLPVVSVASTIYIEFVRGVPLITVLFMAQLLLPLINQQLAEMPNVFRAMIAITLFNAAYLAENVRGGLQSIPHGQQEAALALGLSSFQVTMFITLPQALRAIFPALVGMVISLFKDTSLVAIVGLLDLTGIAQNIVAQPEFIGLRRETLLFITLIYFVVSYAIAGVSRRIELSGAGAARLRQI